MPAGTAATPGVFHAGLRVVTVDGFTLDLPDTDDNAGFFGRGGNGIESCKPLPAAAGVGVGRVRHPGAAGRHLRAQRHRGKTLAEDLLPALGPGMLVLADRNFASFKLWRAAAATGAQLLWRMSASFTLPVRQVLPDGTYLSELKPPRRKDGPPIRSG